MKLTRILSVTVDEKSWTEVAFPPSLHANRAKCDINILMLLLWIGYLTIPTSLRGVSISEYWAWVRYWHALSSDKDLRISRAFAELDPHQKTILSDDFGMGVPILWLNERVQFQSITDGRNFMDHMQAQLGASADTSKVGPTKSPDFVARDAAGVWYVIECKGTQSGRTYRNRQLCERDRDGRPVKGAVVQKRTIQFDKGIDNQRLACGLSIATEGEPGLSDLRIVDPPAESEFMIREDHLDSAIDALSRGRFGRVLRLTGLNWAASAVSTPSRAKQESHGNGSDETGKQREFNEYRIERAKKELSSFIDQSTEVLSGENYYSEIHEFRLPVPIYRNDPIKPVVLLRFCLNAEFLQLLQRDLLIADSLSEGSSFWPWARGPTKLIGDDGAASMDIGNLFSARIEIRES